MAHLLIIRFSSFGDIVQATGIPRAWRSLFEKPVRVDWLVREDFQDLVNSHPLIDHVVTFHRKQGLLKLVGLAWRLGAEPYTHIYDAHNNLRSKVVKAVMRVRQTLTLKSARYLTRPKSRVRRWLFFRLRLKTLPSPFRGAQSFLTPLEEWGLVDSVPSGVSYFPKSVALPDAVSAQLVDLRRPWVALAPSAAWDLKRWPVEHFSELIRSTPEWSFLLLGGPDDHFISQLETQPNVINLAGRLSLAQSSELVKQVDLVVANDTGIFHVADQMEKKSLGLIGPSAFGYPSHLPTSDVSEIELWCKPCSKDGNTRCKNDVYKRCLVELSPAHVKAQATALLNLEKRS